MDRAIDETLDERHVETMEKEMNTEQNKALAIAPTPPKSLAIMPHSYEQVKSMAEDIYNSGLAPDSYNDANQVAVGIMAGLERNLPPLTALKYIAVINGTPYLWGDATVALIRASGKCHYLRMYYDEERRAGVCKTHRKGEPEPQEMAFSMDDAKQAGLLSKKGPWQSYPKRMCMWRATAWLARDVYADCLLGIAIAEEYGDHPGVELHEVAPGRYELKAQTGVQVDDPLDDKAESNEKTEVIDGDFSETESAEAQNTEDFGGQKEDEAETDVFARLDAEMSKVKTVKAIDNIVARYKGYIQELGDQAIAQANQITRRHKDRVQQEPAA